MNNSQHFPFERNRYYAGKMLTSNDFQAEQTYFNNKRRFINNLMFGSGIVCGCEVVSLDDLSLLIESGVAIDDYGREIVIESSVVEKLSAIEGFDSLKSNDVTLCMQYMENPVHSVYAVNQKQSENEYEYNRIVEGYKLFLIDTEEIPPKFELEDDFFSKGTLYEDDDFRIEIITPSVLCKGKNAKVIVHLEKMSASDRALSYSSVIQVPNFNTPTGEHEFEISFDSVSLAMGDSISKEYWVEVQQTAAVDSSFILKSGTAKASVDGASTSVISGFSLKVLLSDKLPRELVSREIGRMSLEMVSMGTNMDYICLAQLKLVRTDSAYIIEEVKEPKVKNYIHVPSQSEIRSLYMDFYTKDVSIALNEPSVVERIAPQKAEDKPEEKGVEMASGTFEIPLGDDAVEGQVIYSSEIMHGLGKGNVYVDVGFEYIAEDITLGRSAKNTVYGDTSLFAEEGGSVAKVTTAVKVNNDKGSFIAAVRLEEDPNYIILSGRWVATKFPSGSELDMTEDYTGKTISAETPTVVMGTKESHYFGVKFNNMQESTLEYELTEPGSGEITSEGIYTAPSKEGVYEILIYCADARSIFTYAYAIVKKKGFEEE